jgi:predicted GNAT family N-acyltransferase
MKFFKSPTFKLKDKDICQILNLKNSQWNYGISSQLKWFKNKKNVFKNDLHFYIKKNKKIIAYVQLGKRKYVINSKLENYILFRTLIVLKDERGKNLSKKIMNKVLKFIKNKKIPCFLLCKKKLIKFYEKYGFEKLNKKEFKLLDHKNLLYGMVYNFSKNKSIFMKKIYYNL